MRFLNLEIFVRILRENDVGVKGTLFTADESDLADGERGELERAEARPPEEWGECDRIRTG